MMSHPPLPPRPAGSSSPQPKPHPPSLPASSPTSSSSSPSPTSLRTSTPPFPVPPSFTLPEYWDFPPFFTLQPNLSTRQRQLRLWVDLLVAFASALTHPTLPTPPPPVWCLTPSLLHPSRTSPSSRSLSLSPSSLTFPLFVHRRLNRQLSGDAVVSVLEEAVAAGYGVWTEGRGACVVSARTLSEWADAIHSWAMEQGMDTGVATVYELQTSAAASKQPFYGLCGELVLGALQRLAQQGRCALIPGSVLSETGVKFRGV